METILDKIVFEKKIEVSNKKKVIDIKSLEKTILFSRNTYSLKDALTNNKTGIIAEFKRNSPSKGIINNEALVNEVTTDYCNAGVAAISILTETNFFKGNDNDIISSRTVNCPILRKDFIIDPFQIIEAKSIGADAILLISAILTKNEIKQFTKLAKSLKLDVLFEIHNKNEFDKICDDIDIVGVNNRDLHSFKVDINNSIMLSEYIGNNFLKVSESGISDAKNIFKLKQYGFNGFLIGENFMKEKNPGLACKNFIETLL